MNLNELEWKRFLRFDEIPRNRQEYYYAYYKKDYENFLFVPDEWRGAYCLDEFEGTNNTDDIFIKREYDIVCIIIQVSPCGTMYRLINE